MGQAVTRSRQLAGRGIAARLIRAQIVVVAACLATAATVALLVAPPIFRQHLAHYPPALSPDVSEHITQAYVSAGVIAAVAALAIALAAAVVVTVHISRRITRPLADLAAAAARIADGDYTTTVTGPAAGPELEQLAAALNHVAERLHTTEDTRRRMLADLAHEMRTPLATMTAYLDAVDDGIATFDTSTSDVLHDQTTRLLRLADDIGDVSRAEEGHLDLRPEPTTLADLAADAAEPLRTAFDTAEVTLHLVQASPAEATVTVDAVRIGQVITNLLTNALRHTPAGGTVTVTTATDRVSAHLTVADTGDGIPAPQLTHIFERFYRGDSARDRSHGGSGIGLTIARAITQAHHGSLTAHSDGPGRGAVFNLTLPLAEALPSRPR